MARSRITRTTRIPRTVITPTRWKSEDRVSWTSANCAVGPPRWADAAGPNAGAAAATASWAFRTTANAPPEYGSLELVM